MGTRARRPRSFGDNWARGNYAANGGAGQMIYSTDSVTWRLVLGADLDRMDNFLLSRRDGHRIPRSRWPKSATARAIRSCWPKSARAWSTSTRAAFGHVGRVQRAVGARRNSDGDGITGDDYGPNCPSIWADNVMNCDANSAAFGDGTAMPWSRRGCLATGLGRQRQQTARSMHPGGVNTCFADGSVHWISDFIQVMPSSRRGTCRFGTV